MPRCYLMKVREASDGATPPPTSPCEEVLHNTGVGMAEGDQNTHVYEELKAADPRHGFTFTLQYCSSDEYYGYQPSQGDFYSMTPDHPFTPLHLRSVEETEAAHDLLELARSAPAYDYQPPTPSVTPGSCCDMQELNHCSDSLSSDGQNSPYTDNESNFATTPSLSPISDSENSSPLSPKLKDGRSKLPVMEQITDRSPFGDLGKQRYTCHECGKHYATSSNLSRHKQTHRTIESGSASRCSVCGKAYVSMPALTMHLLTHKLHHRCDVCGKAFSRPWLLQGHKRSHTGEKPFACSHCNKSFADRSNLRAHMQTHSHLKTFKCKKCNKSFALKSYLNKHYESSCVKVKNGVHVTL